MLGASANTFLFVAIGDGDGAGKGPGPGGGIGKSHGVSFMLHFTGLGVLVLSTP